MNEVLSVFEAGQTRQLGCWPATSKVGDWPLVGEADGAPDLLPENEWYKYDEIDSTTQAWMVVDQSNQNSCGGAGGVQIVMMGREFSGLDRVHLSQAVPYGLGNGGRDQGMSIDMVLKILMDVGTVDVDTIDQYDWRGYNSNRWPNGWRPKAARNMVLEAWRCPTHAHGISAMCHGFPTLLGVRWKGGGGHAIVAGAHKDKKTKILNSWGEDWGDNGRGWLPDEQCEAGVKVYGEWALRVVTDPPNDGDVT